MLGKDEKCHRSLYYIPIADEEKHIKYPAEGKTAGYNAI